MRLVRKWPRDSILRNATLYQAAGLRRGLGVPSLLCGFSLIADFIFCITPHCPTLQPSSWEMLFLKLRGHIWNVFYLESFPKVKMLIAPLCLTLRAHGL